MIDIAAERARAGELLDRAELGDGWREEPAIPDPASIGALDGFRWFSPERQARLNVYVFDHVQRAMVAGEMLVEMIDAEPYHARAAVNGGLLCVGVAELASPESRRAVDAALAAFASDEG